MHAYARSFYLKLHKQNYKIHVFCVSLSIYIFNNNSKHKVYDYFNIFHANIAIKFELMNSVVLSYARHLHK